MTVAVGSGFPEQAVASPLRTAKRMGKARNRRAACTRAAGRHVVGFIKRRTRPRFNITINYTLDWERESQIKVK